MAAPSTRKSSAAAKRPAKSTPNPSTKPFLRFYHSDALRKKTLSVLNDVEGAEELTEHRDALADIVVELTVSGMDSFFMKPLKLAKAGFILEQSANLGMTGVQQVMASVIRQIIGRMDGPQLLSVCGSIRQFML